MPDSIRAIPSNNPSRFFNPEDKALRGFMGCFWHWTCFHVFPSFPHRLLLPSFFDALPLHIGCPALFLHFPSIPLPSVPRCGCSVLFSSFFFIFPISCSFLDFFSYFPRQLFLRFFLVPGRKWKHVKDDRFPQSFRLFRPGHAVLCCRIDGSGVFSLSAAVCLWLFVSSRSCGFVLPYRRFRFFQFIRGSLPLTFGRFFSACSFICRKPV